MASMFTVASRFRRLKFVGSYLSTIEAVGTGSWLSVVQVLLDVSIALLVAIIEFHGGIQRGYRTISSEFFFVKRYMQSHLKCLLRCLRVYLSTFYKFGSQGCCIPPSNSNKATDGAIETSRRTTRTDSQEPAPGTSMKPSYDPTKPWSRRRREFGASAQNGA